MATTNDYLCVGIPEAKTSQWLPPFQLLKYDGTVLFAVANDGTLTTTNNQVVANPGNFKATGTGEIDGNFSIGDAFSGSPTFKVTAASGNTIISGSLTFAGGTCSALLDLSSIAAASAELKIAATSDTPSVTWSSSSGTAINSAAPAGYLKITVGSSARYIPFWA